MFDQSQKNPQAKLLLFLDVFRRFGWVFALPCSDVEDLVSSNWLFHKPPVRSLLEETPIELKYAPRDAHMLDGSILQAKRGSAPEPFRAKPPFCLGVRTGFQSTCEICRCSVRGVLRLLIPVGDSPDLLGIFWKERCGATDLSTVGPATKTRGDEVKPGLWVRTLRSVCQTTYSTY